MIYFCPRYWGVDITSGGPGDYGWPPGLFHFYNRDPVGPDVTIFHQLEDEVDNQGRRKERYFSRTYAVRAKDAGGSVKAHFVLHPTSVPPPTLAEGTAFIADAVVVRVVPFRHGVLGDDVKQDEVRRQIRSEVAIIVDAMLAAREREPKDALLRLEPARLTGTVKTRLERYRLRTNPDDALGESILEWLPVDDGFWLERNGAWDREVKHGKALRNN